MTGVFWSVVIVVGAGRGLDHVAGGSVQRDGVSAAASGVDVDRTV